MNSEQDSALLTLRVKRINKNNAIITRFIGKTTNYWKDSVDVNPFVDSSQRVINYLRVSITDRCNLRCMYCVGNGFFEFIPHDEIVSYEEILHLVRLFVRKGIRKIRVTGGEPLVRKGAIDFLKALREIPGLNEVTLTTNGVLLEKYAAQIRESGVRRLNISMDTLRPDKFALITERICSIRYGAVSARRNARDSRP